MRYLRTENLKNHTLFWSTYLYSSYVVVPYRTATVYNKLSQHLKDYNIVQHTKESTWMNMEITSFAAEEVFWGDQIYLSKMFILLGQTALL